MSRCLVTGGAGFIGSHLVEALLDRGDDVRVIDNFSTGDRRNLVHIAGEIEIVEGDIRSFERVMAAVRGAEFVFHQAALPSVPRSIQDPLTSSDVNVGGTLNVLLACRDAAVRRVIYASSSSVYGGTLVNPKSEDLPVAPLSPYGVSKYAGEAFARSFFEAYGLETVSLRYFNVYGPRQNPLSEYAAVVPSFITAGLLGERPTIFGDGLQSRDFTYVDNVVQANLRAAASTSARGGDVFNIGCGRSYSVNELLEEIAAILDRPIAPNHVAARVGEVRASLADIGKAESVLGYRPAVGLREGLAATCDYFVNDDTLLPRIRERQQWLASLHAPLRALAGSKA